MFPSAFLCIFFAWLMNYYASAHENVKPYGNHQWGYIKSTCCTCSSRVSYLCAENDDLANILYILLRSNVHVKYTIAVNQVACSDLLLILGTNKSLQNIISDSRWLQWVGSCHCMSRRIWGNRIFSGSPRYTLKTICRGLGTLCNAAFGAAARNQAKGHSPLFLMQQ